MLKAIIRERGNGLADVGDYVAGNDGEVYIVTELHGQIQTGRAPGAPSWMCASVELADWGDVDDDNEPACSCEVEDDDA